MTKKVAHKAAREFIFIGNKIASKIVKPRPVPDMNSRNNEEIVIPPEERKKN